MINLNFFTCVFTILVFSISRMMEQFIWGGIMHKFKFNLLNVRLVIINSTHNPMCEVGCLGG